MKIDRVAGDNTTRRSVLRLIECNARYARRAYSYPRDTGSLLAARDSGPPPPSAPAQHYGLSVFAELRFRRPIEFWQVAKFSVPMRRCVYDEYVINER